MKKDKRKMKEAALGIVTADAVDRKIKKDEKTGSAAHRAAREEPIDENGML